LDLYPGGQTPPPPATPAPNNAQALLKGPSIELKHQPLEGVHWKKFEYFNFPVPASNDLFTTL